MSKWWRAIEISFASLASTAAHSRALHSRRARLALVLRAQSQTFRTVTQDLACLRDCHGGLTKSLQLSLAVNPRYPKNGISD